VPYTPSEAVCEATTLASSCGALLRDGSAPGRVP
jgi:hypothetical protein